MKSLVRWLRELTGARPAYVPLQDAEFERRVANEISRIAADRAGLLQVEAATIAQHLEGAVSPEVIDLIDLRAVTVLMVERYDYRPLQELAGITEQRGLLQAFADYFQEPLLEGRSWCEHLRGATTALHYHEMENSPLEWLMEWRPYDLRLDAAKKALLADARLSILTWMLKTLAEREMALLEQGAAVLAAPDYDHPALWHSVTDTRIMRLHVADVWEQHPLIPVDYARAVHEQPPMRQLAVLREKFDTIKALCDEADG